MISVNVRIISKETLYGAPIVDGTTTKRVKFEILRPDVGWLFRYVMTDRGRWFDGVIDKFEANGDVSIHVPEYKGEEPSDMWKHQTILTAFGKANGISWDGGLNDGNIKA